MLDVNSAVVEGRETIVALLGGEYLTPDGVTSRGTVVIRGEHVAEVGDVDAGSLPAETRLVDARGLTILPGLIDAHSHLSFVPGIGSGSIPELAMATVAKARMTRRTGVTFVRDVGGYEHIDLALRRAVEDAAIDGPRMQCAGRAITRVGGHVSDLGIGVTDGGDARAAAHTEIEAGADIVKVMCSGGVGPRQEDVLFTEDDLRGVVAEASGAGIPVAVHAHPAAAVKAAVKAGVSSIEHGSLLDSESAAMLADSGTYLVPTFAIYQHLAQHAAGTMAATSRVMLEQKLASFRLALDAGVRWGVGSDADRSATPLLLLDEASFLVHEVGLSAAEVVRALTMGNAELLGISDQIGAIRTGAWADLSVVAGNPLADIEALRRVVWTSVRGVFEEVDVR